MSLEAVPQQSSSDIQSDKDDINGTNGASHSPKQMPIAESDSVHNNQVRFAWSYIQTIKFVYKHFDSRNIEFVLFYFALQNTTTSGSELTERKSIDDNLEQLGYGLEKSKSNSRVSDRVKKKTWYNIIYPSYKSRCESFKKLFKEIPDDQRLIVGMC